jgi:protein-L-isoaspartate(D-aspartate) O-methyltransferase
MNIEQARFNMVEQQTRPWDVLDQTVLDLLMQVKRETFVPSAHQLLAFTDTEIALTAGGAGSGEVMLAPKYDAKMLQELQLTKTEAVLEIGTGSGYATALLAKLARHITSLEINPQLAAQAQRNLATAGIANATVHVADGSRFSSTEKFDAIVLGGSVSLIPQNLLDCLREGGKLYAYLGQAPVMKAVLCVKAGKALPQTTLFETNIAPLREFASAASFVF